MKKLSYILFSIAALAWMVSSCTPKEEEKVYQTSTKLSSIVFSANDSFPGIENASFTIDFSYDTALVYNEDSLPYGTKLDSVAARFFFETTIGYALFCSDSDSVILSTTDTLDFRPRPCLLYVLSEDQKNEQYYHIYVNVHQVDPDLYVWNCAKENLFSGNKDVHAEYFNDQICLFTQDGMGAQLYTSPDGILWSAAQSPTGLPAGANVRQIIKGKDFLFYAEGTRLYSSADGLNWTVQDCSSLGLTLESMLFYYHDLVWAVASDAAGKYYFTAMEENGAMAKQDIKGIDALSEHFPVSDFSTLAFIGKSGRLRALIMGGYDKTGTALNSRWSLEWVQETANSGFYRMENFTIEQPSFAPLTGASLVWYDDHILMFGGADENTTIGTYPILESVDEGMNWTVPDSASNCMPEGYKQRQRQTAIVLPNQTIVLIGGQSRTESFSDVYLGKKNSMSFINKHK